MNLTVVFLKAMKYTYIFVVLLLHSSNIVVVQGGMTVAMNASCFATGTMFHFARDKLQ